MSNDPELPNTVISWFMRNSDAIHAEISKRVVRLCWMTSEHRPAGSASLEELRPTCNYGTGFLARVGPIAFVCTAGHVIQKIKSGVSPARKLVAFEAQWSLEGGNPVRISLIDGHLDIGAWVDGPNGLDVGVIGIPVAAETALAAAGAKCFDAIKWEPPTFEPDFFVCAGFPKDNRRESVVISEGHVIFSDYQECPLIPVAATRDERFGADRLQKFRGVMLSQYGRLPGGQDCVVKSVNGMSGGPILAIKLTEKGWHQQIVAIITDEREDEKTVVGCFFNHFLQAVRGDL